MKNRQASLICRSEFGVQDEEKNNNWRIKIVHFKINSMLSVLHLFSDLI